MTEESNLAIGRLQGRMESHEKRLDDFEGRVDKRLESIEGKVQQILDAANMGKGAWWLVLKIGAALSALTAAGLWVYDHLRMVFR